MDQIFDAVLLVDDFHPATTRRQKADMEYNLEQIVRFFGDSIGKSRSSRDMEKQKRTNSQGMCVITGEDTSGTESSLLRCILIETCKTTFKPDVLTQFQKDPVLWTTHLAHFVKYIGKHYDFFQQRISSEVPAKGDAYRRYFRGSLRLSRAAAILSETAQILLNYFQENGVLCASQYWTQWEDAIIQALVVSEDAAVQLNPVKMYLYAIYKLHEGKKFSVATNSEDYLKSEACGYEEDGFWYLEPDKTYRAVLLYWEHLQKRFPLSRDAIHKALGEANVIRTQQKKRKSGQVKTNYLYKISLSPKRPRFLAIDYSAMVRLLESEI